MVTYASYELVEVPAKQMGRVIGRNGATGLKNIKKTTGVSKCNVVKDVGFALLGSVESVAAARSMIKEIAESQVGGLFEKRLDPSNGHAYTFKEFQAFYLDRAEELWKKAGHLQLLSPIESKQYLAASKGRRDSAGSTSSATSLASAAVTDVTEPDTERQAVVAEGPAVVSGTCWADVTARKLPPASSQRRENQSPSASCSQTTQPSQSSPLPEQKSEQSLRERKIMALLALHEQGLLTAEEYAAASLAVFGRCSKGTTEPASSAGQQETDRPQLLDQHEREDSRSATELPETRTTREPKSADLESAGAAALSVEEKSVPAPVTDSSSTAPLLQLERRQGRGLQSELLQQDENNIGSPKHAAAVDSHSCEGQGNADLPDSWDDEEQDSTDLPDSWDDEQQVSADLPDSCSLAKEGQDNADLPDSWDDEAHDSANLPDSWDEVANPMGRTQSTTTSVSATRGTSTNASKDTSVPAESSWQQF
eukprot:SAG31_NODE_233_length_19705_cov_8.775426_2_plen_481_part_00